MEKLDRILMSKDLEDMFPQVNVRKLVRDASAHNALLLSSDNLIVRSPQVREFRFEIGWLKNEEFIPLVEEIWKKHVRSNDPIDILNIKLERIGKIKGWGSNKFGHDRKKKNEIKEELLVIENLEEQGALDPDMFCKEMELLVELNGIMVNEELYLLQQSHEKCGSCKGTKILLISRKFPMAIKGKILSIVRVLETQLLKKLKTFLNMLPTFTKCFLGLPLATYFI